MSEVEPTEVTVEVIASSEIVTSSGGRIPIPGGNGGTLYAWPKGVSGNPAGRPKNRVVRLFNENINSDEVANSIWAEYMRLALHARSEELRAKLLGDLLDRVGLPRQSGGEHSPSAVAQVVNIIRNSPELGV